MCPWGDLGPKSRHPPEGQVKPHSQVRNSHWTAGPKSCFLIRSLWGQCGPQAARLLLLQVEGSEFLHLECCPGNGSPSCSPVLSLSSWLLLGIKSHLSWNGLWSLPAWLSPLDGIGIGPSTCSGAGHLMFCCCAPQAPASREQQPEVGGVPRVPSQWLGSSTN